MRREPTSEELNLIKQLGIQLAKTNNGFEYIWRHRRFINPETAIDQVRKAIAKEEVLKPVTTPIKTYSSQSTMSSSDAFDIASDFAKLNATLSAGFYDECILPWSKSLIYKALKKLVIERTSQEQVVLAQCLGIYLSRFQAGIGNMPLNAAGNPEIITEIMASERSEDEKVRLLQRHFNNNSDNANQFSRLLKLREKEIEANSNWLF